MEGSKTNMDRDRPIHTAPSLLEGPTLQWVRDALSGLEFGSVQITVHEGRVVYVDRHERKRFNNTRSGTNR